LQARLELLLEGQVRCFGPALALANRVAGEDAPADVWREVVHALDQDGAEDGGRPLFHQELDVDPAPGHGEPPMRGPGGKEALATIEGLDPSLVFGNLAEVERPHLAEEEEAVRGARGEPAEDPSRGQAAVALDRDLA